MDIVYWWKDMKVSRGMTKKLHQHQKHPFGFFLKGCHMIRVDTFWLSPPGTFHILVGKFLYFIIRFYNKTMKLKSDKLIGKFWNRKKRRFRPWTSYLHMFLNVLREFFSFPNYTFRKSIGILGTCKTVRTPPPQHGNRYIYLPTLLCWIDMHLY